MRLRKAISYSFLWLGSGCNLGVPPSGTASQPVDEQAAAEAAIKSARTIALLAYAIRPAGDLQAIFEQGMPFPACPQLGPSFDGNTIDLTMEFGEGCSVLGGAGPRIAGRLSGEYLAGTHAFQFALTDVVPPGEAALNGSAAGSFAFPGDTVLYLTIDVTRPDGWNARGTARVEFPPAGDAIRVSEASVTIATPGASHSVSLRHVRIEPATSPLSPSAGSATVTSPDAEGTGVQLDFSN